MLNSIYKRTYRGRGIYWYPGWGYGDETQAFAPTIAECQARIDLLLAEEERNKPEHLKYWDSLSPEERNKWRKLSISTDLSASELAYTNKA